MVELCGHFKMLTKGRDFFEKRRSFSERQIESNCKRDFVLSFEEIL